MPRFYVGASELGYLTMPTEPGPAAVDVGWCMSHRRLARRPRSSPFPRATRRWFLDSGMFGYCRSQLTPPSPREYVDAVWRYDREIGSLDWAAQQDLMCEPWMLRLTGRSVWQNQVDTIANFKILCELWWERADRDTAEHCGFDPTTYRSDRDPSLCPFMPTLQGFEAWEYRRHVDMWYAAGVRLEDYQVVGIGSVCGRDTLAPIRHLVAELAGFVDLHGFGMKTTALAEFGAWLPSADSHAWAKGARHRLGACRHGLVRWERNCPVYALEWGAAVLAGAGEPVDWTDRWTGRRVYGTGRAALPVLAV